MIVVTGAAGFIASALVGKLNKEGYNDIVVVDDFSREDKKNNLRDKTISEWVDRKEFHSWLDRHHKLTEFIFHLGARTDTTEFDVVLFDELNLNYTKSLWKQCVKYGLPLVYASSAATYGMGELGYEDKNELCFDLVPLNPYGDSKNDFDKWALEQDEKPYHWVGCKFFNVYGPNEYHKGRMASVVFHTYNQIQKTGGMKLFASHNPDYKDGEQIRDFIYVEDVLNVLMFHMEKRDHSGLYNLGTGKSRTFYDLAAATFRALDLEPKISFVPTPEDIRDKYQYFTEATVEKLRAAGYDKPFTELEDGINDYVKNYLSSQSYY
ncbi:MAG: ADP-L-glycero-D-manno-heptose 6-epimerase [Salibacteraceae bacterium]|jgi:ADP-L-glycero-D-manno-heptose 6-epimerase